jgi:hypothetical protein
MTETWRFWHSCKCTAGCVIGGPDKQNAIEMGQRYIKQHREMCNKTTEYAYIRNNKTKERIKWADIKTPTLFESVDL